MTAARTDIVPPFGTHALPPLRERIRLFGERVPRRWMVSLLRRLILSGRSAPFDVTVFGSQRVRLYPFDNRTEKRVLSGTQFWDRVERQRLTDLVRAAGAEGFTFVDVGANVGMYTFAVRAAAQAAQVPLRSVAFEPDPINGARLAANLALSEAEEVVFLPVAVGGEEGEVAFESADLNNRGQARISDRGTVKVTLRPLAAALRDVGLTRVDALKMDIEGHEPPALRAFFTEENLALYPRLCLIETAGSGGEIDAILEGAGYRVTSRHRLNTLYERP